MSSLNQPAWQAGFPVRQSAEHRVSRRQFTRFACCSAITLGAAWLARDPLFPPPAPGVPTRVARLDELPVGGYKLFRYPTEAHPAILVRLSKDEFAAFSQACTHLLCPVHYRHETRQFHCPCHEGFFSAHDGSVVAGPPPRPLPRHPVTLRDGEVWVGPDGPTPAIQAPSNDGPPGAG